MARKVTPAPEATPDLGLLLAARLAPDAKALPGYRLKMLPDGMVTAWGLPTAAPEIDAGKMCVTVKISTPTPDLSNDIVVGKGIDTAIHKLNPLVLLQHMPTMPIARAVDPDGNYTVRVVGEDTYGTSYFFQNSPEAEQAFRLVEMGALNGASVKIKPKAGMVETVRGPEGEGPYALLKGTLLLEYSHVFFGDNPEALVVAIEKGFGGKPMCERLRVAFAPYIPLRAPTITVPALPVEKSAMTTVIAKEKNDSDADSDDKRPYGAQYGGALYEMACAMSEFAEKNASALEPEAAEAWSGVHEHISKLMDHLAETYSSRHPDLPKLAKAEEGDEDKPDEKPEEREKRRQAMTDEERTADDERERRRGWRVKSRALVRGWWKQRQAVVAEAEAQPVVIARELLEKLSKHNGPITADVRMKAAAAAKRLTAPAATSAVTPTKPPIEPVSDWSAVAAKLAERETLLKAS